MVQRKSVSTVDLRLSSLYDIVENVEVEITASAEELEQGILLIQEDVHIKVLAFD